MGLKIKGIRTLQRRLENVGERSSEGVRAELEDGAKKIKLLGRQYAPVDKMNLEKAIKYRKVRAAGINRRDVFEVYVDESKPVPGAKNGKKVGDYAKEMHERTDYKLGDRSREKQRQTSSRVGPKYLTRAFNKMKPFIQKKLNAALAKAVRRRGI